MTTTIFQPDVLIDGSGAPPRHDAAVRVEDGVIAAIGTPAEVSASAPEDRTTRTGGTLTPGLIDAHVHLAWGLDGQERWPRVGGGAEGRTAWAAASAQAALAAGVTTMRDCGAAGLEVVGVRDAIDAGILTGPRLLACGPAITTTAGHGDFIGVCADTADELRRTVRRLCLDGVDFVKVMASGGDMDPHTNRRRPQYTDEQMAALVEDAHRLALPVVAHCNAADSIRQCVSAGVDTIAHCNWLGIEEGTIAYDGVVASEMLDAGTFIDLNIDGTLRPYAPDGDGFAQAWEQGAPPRNRWELHAEMRERGGRLLFTSDEFGGRLVGFPGLIARVVAESGADIAEAIQRATSVPAEAVGRGGEVGVIEPGMRADLVLFDHDLEAYPGGLEGPRAVWLDGRLVAEDGRIALGEVDR